MSTKARKITVTFQGVDFSGNEFTYSRTVDSGWGDHPIFYGEQFANAAAKAAMSIREAVEATYGKPPEGDGK